MDKGHRDNHKARKKRGTVAFEKRAMRRVKNPKRTRCLICGANTRTQKTVHDVCERCYERALRGGDVHSH